MSAKSSSRKPKPSRDITVPRDRETDDPRQTSAATPSPESVQPADEDYTDEGKPLVEGSYEAKALHDRPPPAKGELGVGTAGDAARPTKPGLRDKPIPQRGAM